MGKIEKVIFITFVMISIFLLGMSTEQRLQKKQKDTIKTMTENTMVWCSNHPGRPCEFAKISLAEYVIGSMNN